MVRLSLHGPQTIRGILGMGAAGGVSLFLVLFGVATCGRTLREAPATAPTELRAVGLQFPVPAVSPRSMSNSFEDRRSRGAHHAVDIFAPRHSFVVAVDDGTVVQLARTAAGGITVYQFDTAQRYCYYYAHLEGYVPGLIRGQEVKRGQVLGYVGTTGNAPRNTPHLHFAISLVAAPKQWWGGSPIDPYPIWAAK
jgi:murein DD-endopeptidase MepM/ murein hydrolase activator NlpD